MILSKVLTLCLLLGFVPLAAQNGREEVVSEATAASDIRGTLFSPDSLDVSLEPASEIDSLFYAADSIRAYYEQEQIWLYGNTSIDYGTSHIMADSLFLDLKKERAISLGRTRMQDGDQLLIGENVHYDVGGQTGMLSYGRSYIENGYYWGDEIRKIGSNIYDIDGGSFTTCDLEEPSYWFWAHKMRIYQKDKVVGKHVLAYVNHLPIFYFPFVTMSIRRGRHPGFLIPEPGYNNVDGKYIRDLAYYYPYKDYADFIVGLDLMEKTGWKSYFSTIYQKRYEYNGSLRADFQRNTYGTVIQNDWAVRAGHHHDLPEKSSLDVSLDFISNKRIWESSNSVDESLAQRLSSSIAYRKPIGSTYFNAGALYSQDLINDTASLSLPSVTWSVSSRPLYELLHLDSNAWYSNLSYYYNFRMDHTGQILDPDPDLQDYIWANTIDPENADRYLVEHHMGMKHALGLSNSYNYRGWLNLRQSVDYAEAWFDRDKNDKKPARGNDYSASLNGNFNIYGLRTFQNLPVSAIRHVMTPSVGLSFIPDHSRNDIYYGFGGISLRRSKKQASLSFSLGQKWQFKFGSGKLEKKVNDLFTWDSRIAANLYKDDNKFGDISHSFAFKPGSFNLGSITSDRFSLGDIRIGYNSRLSMTQKTYEIGKSGLALRNQYFSQGISLSGTAMYADYFPALKNRSFESFGETQEDPTATVKSESWSLDISHDLSADKSLFDSRNQNLRMNAGLYLTKNYNLNYSNYFNVKENKLISQSIRLTRDLHCWKLDLSFTKRNEYWDYRIVFFNTQFPDALKFQTRDSKRY
ncbi:MAG: putative LPS assembly protein LptD [Candidatus Cloacimonetes bacterium]|nr:putative LPS assembly protein LptD [Candidatus Cloacimonadota bacterium]